jgi:nucleoside-diphosphate-sugar epimerase
MQTIIGSGGAIGVPLAKELAVYTKDIRLVSRSPKKVNDTDTLFPCDLTDLTQIDAAVAGSDIVYVTVGFEYNIRVWQQTWPPFMRAVVDACMKHKAKLVFFDNVYSYDPSSVTNMTEENALNPSSKKGKVRKQLVDMIMQEVKKGALTAMIVRAADFYGPGVNTSVLIEMAAKPMKQGKTADALGNIDKIHTYTYTPDAGKATAILGNTPDAYNQVWHLPTTKEKLTTRQWMEMTAKEIGVKPKIRVAPLWMLKVMGWFVPVMREFPEMLYQYDQDYIFDSSKFEKRFGMVATTPAEGIRAMVKAL